MTIETLTIGDPFFSIRILTDEDRHPITGKTIVLNLADAPLRVRDQSLRALQSVILKDTEIRDVSHAVLIEGFTDHAGHPHADALRLKSFILRQDLSRDVWLDGSVVDAAAHHVVNRIGRQEARDQDRGDQDRQRNPQ